MFVTKLFESILGRSPSANEQSSWEAPIAAGTMTRAAAARQLADNGEAFARYDADVTVASAYAGLLARMPDLTELTEWRARLASGLSKRGLAQAFLVSSEYRARFES